MVQKKNFLPARLFFLIFLLGITSYSFAGTLGTNTSPAFPDNYPDSLPQDTKTHHSGTHAIRNDSDLPHNTYDYEILISDIFYYTNHSYFSDSSPKYIYSDNNNLIVYLNSALVWTEEIYNRVFLVNYHIYNNFYIDHWNYTHKIVTIVIKVIF